MPVQILRRPEVTPLRERRPFRVAGVDLGQAQDPATCVVLELPPLPHESDEYYEQVKEETATVLSEQQTARTKQLLGGESVTNLPPQVEPIAPPTYKPALVKIRVGDSEIPSPVHCSCGHHRQAHPVAKGAGTTTKQVNPCTVPTCQCEGWAPDQTYWARVVSIKEWPLNTDYNDVVADVLNLQADVLLPEFNGVGRPVMDMLRREARRLSYKGKILPFLTANSRVQSQLMQDPHHKSVWVMPKTELVSAINALRSTRGILFSAADPMTSRLFDQMRDFQMKITSKANTTFGGPGGLDHHFDLVISLGCAAAFVMRYGARNAPAIYHGENPFNTADLWHRHRG